jgi:hypothetical protein
MKRHPKQRGPKLKEADRDAYVQALKGKKQSEIAAERGVSQPTISRSIARAEVILGPEWVKDIRNKLAALGDLAVSGVERHLKQPLPNPQVLNAHLTGTTAYQNKVEVTASLTVEEIAKRRKEKLAAGLDKFKEE